MFPYTAEEAEWLAAAPPRPADEPPEIVVRTGRQRLWRGTEALVDLIFRLVAALGRARW